MKILTIVFIGQSIYGFNGGKLRIHSYFDIQNDVIHYEPELYNSSSANTIKRNFKYRIIQEYNISFRTIYDLRTYLF